MNTKKLLSVIFALVLVLSLSIASSAQDGAVAIDKEAFDALLASGPVADDAAVAAIQWASAVKEAGIIRFF